jgi:hypothetical protein
MPIPTWSELIMVADHIGVCGLTLLVLVWHMVREERSRREWNRRWEETNGKEG